MGNTFGELFRVTTFGESHGGGIGVVIDGCPPRIEITEAHIQRSSTAAGPARARSRRSAKKKTVAKFCPACLKGKRSELPSPSLCGTKTLDPKITAKCAQIPAIARRLHLRGEIRNPKLAGRWPRICARNGWSSRGRRNCAKRILATFYADFEIVAYVTQIHGITAKVDRSVVKMKDVEKHAVRCPDATAAKRMMSLIEQIRDEGDSIGGVIECVARGIEPGLGEPVFDKLEADLAKAMLSLPAAKAFEIGSGFAATRMRGSEHNDAFEMRGGKIRTTNELLRRHSGWDQQWRRHLLSCCV